MKTQIVYSILKNHMPVLNDTLHTDERQARIAFDDHVNNGGGGDVFSLIKNKTFTPPSVIDTRYISTVDKERKSITDNTVVYVIEKNSVPVLTKNLHTDETTAEKAFDYHFNNGFLCDQFTLTKYEENCSYSLIKVLYVTTLS